MNITTEYSLWYILLCLALGFVYAFLFYYKANDLKEVSRNLVKLLFAFRFIAVSVLAFLLLNPILRTLKTEIEKPVLIFLQDKSESLKADTAYLAEYKNNVNAFIKDLSQTYDVVPYSFDSDLHEGLADDYNGKQTDIDAALKEIKNRYSNRNVGALILASDGIYNKGANPIYKSQQIQFPIYTIAMGDTVVKRDLLINSVRYNKISFLGNKFPLEINILAKKCAGEKAQLNVLHEGKVVHTSVIDISSENFTKTLNLFFEAEKPGIHAFKINVSPLSNESSLSNNSKEIYIDVLDSRQKILLLASAPHPDIAAIRSAINTSEQYEIDVLTIDKFNTNPKAYNLIILHGLPDNNLRNYEAKLNECLKANVSVWWIFTSNTSIEFFNRFNQGLLITQNRSQANEVTPAFNTAFVDFTFSAALQKSIRDLPPLKSPFGDYKSAVSSSVALFQKIGPVQTQTPLLSFNTINETKIGILAGEGIWKWRLTSFKINNTHDSFNELILKITQFLSVREDKSFFKIIAKTLFTEVEPILFDAQVYNPSYELINEPDVSIDIVSEKGEQFPFVFSKTADSYRLNAGIFAPGKYSYTAKVSIGANLYQEKGQFSVSALNVEFANTEANHSLLYKMASQSGAEMFYPTDFTQLKEQLVTNEKIKPVYYSEVNLDDFIHVKWPFFIILLILAFEWFLRKRNGAY